jgi:hypothetical protein
MAEQWFYSNDGRQLGPVSEAALRELAAQGQLLPTDLVWTEGMSSWVPAASARGLFPAGGAAAPAATASMPDPVPEVPVVKPAAPRPATSSSRNGRSRDWGDDDDGYYRRRRRTAEASEGMSTGVKVAIACCVVGVLGIFGVVAIVIVGAAIGSAASTVASTPPPGGPPPAPRRGGNPAPAAADPAQTNSYKIKLMRSGDNNIKVINLKKGQVVHLTVTSTNWSGNDGFFQPDVDVYLEDKDGQQVFDDDGPVLDDGPEKDCDVVFCAPHTGQYRIRVHNCPRADGIDCWVECTVRY